MQGQRDHGHLELGVSHDDAARDIDARGARVDDGDHIVGLAHHEQARKRDGVDADVEHGAAGELAVEEAVLGVELLEATEVELCEVHVAKLTGHGAADELAVERHVQDRSGIHELHVVGVGDGEGLGKLLGVEGDGLLAQDVLTRAERAAQVVDVRVVRRGDVDRVDVGVGIEVLEGVVDLGDAPALGEGLGLLAVAVGHAHELAAGQGE